MSRKYFNRTEQVLVHVLYQEISVLPLSTEVEGVTEVVNEQVGIDFVGDPSVADETMVQNAINAHVAIDYKAIQVEQAENSTKSLFRGLQQLDPADAVYAAYGRSWAANNGENQATIDAIVDRATAGQYITAQSEWSALPAASKQFMIAHIDAEMKLFQAIIKVLT